MNRFTVKDANSSAELVFLNEDGTPLGSAGSYSFTVRLADRTLSAGLSVYDLGPQGWGEFFADLAANWRGWKGAKERKSIEGQLKLSATCDRLGHVELLICICETCGSPMWSAESSIFLEAGQLERIAREAKDFFGRQGTA